MLLITPSAFIKQTHSDNFMADALSLGLRAFDGLRCPIQKPPGCIFEGGNISIDTNDNKVLSNPECPICGLTPKMEIMESSLEFDSEGVAQIQAPLPERLQIIGISDLRAFLTASPSFASYSFESL